MTHRTSAQKRPFRNLARGCLTALGILSLCAVLGYAILDYINFPFLPLDLLRRMGAVDVRCEASSEFAAEFLALIREEGGVRLLITKKNGEPVTQVNRIPERTDGDGLVKVYLPRGRYQIRAEVRGVVDGQMVIFANVPSGGQEFQINQAHSMLELQMSKVDIPDPEEERARLDDLIITGRIDEAISFALSLSDKGAGPEIEELLLKLQQLSAIHQQAAALPLASYNSSIDFHQQMLVLMNELVPGQQQARYRIKTGTRTVPLAEHINAIAQARDKVIDAHLRDYQVILESGDIIMALEQWLKVDANPELYRDGFTIAQQTADRLQHLYPSAQELKTQVTGKLRDSLEEAVSDYNRGRITEARAKFSDLHRQAQVFTAPLALGEDFKTRCEEYLRDVTTLVQADEAYRYNRYADALTLYFSVQHSSPWLNQRIRETEELL